MITTIVFDWDDTLTGDRVYLFAGVESLLRKLQKKNIRIHIVSTGCPSFTIKQTLQSNGITIPDDNIVGSVEMTNKFRTHNKSVALDNICKQEGITKDNIAFYDDKNENIQDALNAGYKNSFLVPQEPSKRFFQGISDKFDEGQEFRPMAARSADPMTNLINIIKNTPYWKTKSKFTFQVPTTVKLLQQAVDKFDAQLKQDPEQLFRELRDIALLRLGQRNLFYLFFEYNNRDPLTESLQKIFREADDPNDLANSRSYQTLCDDIWKENSLEVGAGLGRR